MALGSPRLVLACTLILQVGISQADATKSSDDVLVGAIRWDNWRLDSNAGDVLADPALRNRIPYYAMRQPDGRLGFPGDQEYVLQADVYYARAAGIDYFLFGYYLDTGSWGRDKNKAQALDRAFHSYLNLSDRAGVKFALMFNWSFPPEDVDDVAQVIASVANHSDYVQTRRGALPVFMFTPSVDMWAKGLGGEVNASAALQHIRERVQQASGKRLYFVAMLFGIDQGGPQAVRIGFDAISTYANGTGSGGQPVPYTQCAAWARDFWRKAQELPVGFLPTVTMGWDYRPLLKSPSQSVDRNQNPSWCEPASDDQWTDQIRLALAEALENERSAEFRSVVFYAWNEFSEGGWISPTVGEGTRRIGVLANGLQRDRGVHKSVELRWPASNAITNCGRDSVFDEKLGSKTSCEGEPDGFVVGWPCPIGLTREMGESRRVSNAETAISSPSWISVNCR